MRPARQGTAPLCGLALLLCLAACTSWRARSASTTPWIGGRHRGGISPSGFLRVRWQVQQRVALKRGRNLGIVHSSPTVIPHALSHREEIVLVPHPIDARVDAFDARGRALGHFETPARLSGTIAACGNQLLLPSSDRKLIAWSTDTFDTQWQSDLPAQSTKRPVCQGGVVFVVTQADHVLAFDSATGQPRWRYQRRRVDNLTTAPHANLLVDGDALITGFSDGYVVALSRHDGSVLWERDTTVEAASLDRLTTPFLDVDTTPYRVAGGGLIVAGFSVGGFELAPYSGSVRWFDERLRSTVDVTASADSRTLFFASVDQGIVAWDRERSAARWRRPLKHGSPSAVRRSGQRLIVSDSRRGVVGIDAGTGRVLGRVEARDGVSAPVALGRETAYVQTNAGTLLALAL